MKRFLVSRPFRRVALAALVGWFLAGSHALAQCAMCSGAADATSGQFAYSKSTLFMLSIPYLLLGGVGGYVVHAFRKARDDSRSEDSGEPGGE
jgi:hypothetical protein